METNIAEVEINGVKYIRKDAVSTKPEPGANDIRIVVLQRGWVVVGQYTETGDDVTITKASVIRVWGTTKGLGELVNGPTSKTVLDPSGTVKATKIGIVMTLDCEASKWQSKL